MEERAEMEIDIGELFRYLQKKIVSLVAITLVCGMIGWAVSSFLLTPQYTASTRVYVLSRSNDSIVYSDIQISTYVSRDFEVLITGPNVTREVISRLGLNTTNAKLAKGITVTALEDTRVLQIDYVHEDPQMAADILNCIREVSAEQIRGFVDADAVKTVYPAEAPKLPSSPNVGRNTVLAAVLGLMSLAGVYVIRFILDDTIRTEEDVARYLGLSVLGVIPESEELRTQRNVPGKKRKAARGGK